MTLVIVAQDDVLAEVEVRNGPYAAEAHILRLRRADGPWHETHVDHDDEAGHARLYLPDGFEEFDAAEAESDAVEVAP